MNTKDIAKLSESITVFGTISGQLKYALMLYDEFHNKTVPEYNDGKLPHPFVMLAEEKVLIELDNFRHESDLYNKLMKSQVPPEYVAFKKRLRKEAWTMIVRNKLIAHKRRDKSGAFVSLQQISKIYNPDPDIFRQIGEELKNVLTKIGSYYIKDTWFSELKRMVLNETFSPRRGDRGPISIP